jgi:hypothetical protein
MTRLNSFSIMGLSRQARIQSARIADQVPGVGLARFGDPARCFLNSRTGKPPTPQFPASTSWMVTKVESKGLPSTSSKRSLTPLISHAFS